MICLPLPCVLQGHLCSCSGGAWRKDRQVVVGGRIVTLRQWRFLMLESPDGLVVEVKPDGRCKRRVRTRRRHKHRKKVATLATQKAHSFVRKNGGDEAVESRPALQEEASAAFMKAESLRRRAK
ncbi:MAG: hypothetical protein ABIA92_00605 [Patescibacteria group bacterium]